MTTIATSSAATKQEIRDVCSLTVFANFVANDATPSVASGGNFKTANTLATTITAFDSGYTGQVIRVVVNDANTTFDFTASNLRGNGGADWTASSGDCITAVRDSSGIWYCIISAPAGGGGGGAVNLDGLTDVVITAPAKNQRLIHNGTNWVNVAEDTSFLFSIASFTSAGFSTGTVLAGNPGATLNATSTITYSASYTNGPATSGNVTSNQAGFTTIGLASFVGPTVDATNALTYPAVGSTRTVTLTANDGTGAKTSVKTATFHNYIKTGKSSKASGYNQTDWNTLAQSVISNDNTQIWSSINLTAEYWIMAVPQSRVGAPTAFKDYTTGFAVSMFGTPEVVSIDNGNGLTENYLIIRSLNPLTYTSFIMQTL